MGLSLVNVIDPFAVDGVLISSEVQLRVHNGPASGVLRVIRVDALGGALVRVVGLLADFCVVRPRRVAAVGRGDEVVKVAASAVDGGPVLFFHDRELVVPRMSHAQPAWGCKGVVGYYVQMTTFAYDAMFLGLNRDFGLLCFNAKLKLRNHIFRKRDALEFVSQIVSYYIKKMYATHFNILCDLFSKINQDGGYVVILSL